VGVKKLTRNFGDPGEGVNPAIDGIAGHGAASGGCVNPDLVGATCMKAEFEEACAGPRAENFPIGFCGATTTPDGHALAGDGVATDGAFPRACVSAGPTENVGEIGFFCFTISKLAAEFAVSGIIFCRDEKTCGFTIQTMNNSWAVGGSAWGEVPFAMVEKSGGERASGSACAGVDVHSGGFIDDENIFVFEENF
jgi:hypothetical protein